MMVLISHLYFRLMGWKVEGMMLAEVKRCVMIAAPHTSNHDFLFTRAACYMMNIKVRYLIKKSWMVFPLCRFFHATGAVPVERNQATGLVDRLIRLFYERDELVLLLSPEGTRKAVEKWKSGFYHAALGANVPIVLGYLDYKKKVAGIGPVIHPSGDFEHDMKRIQDFYRNITAKHPAAYV
ncbi:MAG: 1-acyl-sn-glycerol-3-phosphate acyltransferase [Bacillota bacterium]|nr:1-acyl-sn-glycerol-3-phosphate acyltransferase [Bacillota bacterium]